MSLQFAPEQLAPSTELNIRDYVSVLRRRKVTFIQVFVVLLGMGILATAISKPVYETRAKLLVPAGSNSVSFVDSNNPIAPLFAPMQPDSVDTQVQVLQSAPFLADANRKAGVVAKPGVVPPSVRIDTTEGSNIIQITVDGGDPHDIAKLANTIVDLHRERMEQLATTGLRSTIQFVQSEKDKTGRSLAEADRKLVRFRQAHPGIDITAQRDERTGEYAGLMARVIELETDISTTKAQMASLKSRLAKEPAELEQVTTKENPRVAKLRDELDRLQFQRMDLLREYRPTSRPIQDLDGQVARLQRELTAEPSEIRSRTHSPNTMRAMLQTRLEEMESALQGYEQNYNAAQSQYKAQKGLLASLGPWEAMLAQLNRDRDAIQASYTFLADHLRDLEIRKGAGMPAARPIEWAFVPIRPIRPQKTNSIVLSALLALLVAVSTVFLQEFLDDRVNSPADLERITPLRVLARVPLIGPKQPCLVAALPAHSPVAEAYRALRSSIGFAGFESPLRRIQITSAGQGEGKSTTSINLATAMARDGKQVILIDADLRWPNLHRTLGLSESPGLSEVLAGMTSLEEALQATEIDNLMVLTAGTIPPNPAELLGSPAFDRLLEQLDERANVVIVDTPPCVLLTDPLIVAARMDGVVLVIQVGQSRRGDIREAMELLGQARARILGLVLNRVQPHQRGYYRHSYHYGAGAAAPGGEPHVRNGKAAHPALESGEFVPVNPRPVRDADEA